MKSVPLSVLIVGQQAETQALLSSFAQIQRWQVTATTLPHFPLECSSFDVAIAYGLSSVTQLREHWDVLPILVIGEQAPPPLHNLEFLAIDAVNAVTLEMALRLCLLGHQCSPVRSVVSPEFSGLNSLGEAIHEVLILLSPDYKIMDWNHAAIALFGYDGEEVLGRDYNLLCTSPGDRQPFLRAFQRALHGEIVTDHQHLVLAKDGHPEILHWRLTPFRNPMGRIMGIICAGQPLADDAICHDFLGQEIYQALQKLQIGVMWLSGAGHCLGANQVFQDKVGWNNQELQGKHLTDLIASEADAGGYFQMLQDIRRGIRRGSHCQLPLQRQQGDRLWLEAMFTTLELQGNLEDDPLIVLVQESQSLSASTQELQEYLQLSQTLVQFAHHLSSPPIDLTAALGLWGKQLTADRVTILRWTHQEQRRQDSPRMVAQWSVDGTPPCHRAIAEIPVTWWHNLLQDQQGSNIYDVAYYPEFQQHLQALRVTSFLALPIWDLQQKLWGYLVLTGDRPRQTPYSDFTLQSLKITTELIHHYLVQVSTQQELEASEALYAGIFSHSAEAIFLFSVQSPKEFVFEMVNPAYCEQMNILADAVIGQSPLAVFPEAIATEIQDACESCYYVGETLLLEQVFPLASQQMIWRTCLIPIRDRQGNITQIQGSARNITEERQFELSRIRQTRYQNLLSSLTLKILQSWQINEMVTTTVKELRRTLQADRVIFYNLNDERSGTVISEARIPSMISMLNETLPMIAFDRGDFAMFYQGEIQTCINIESAKFPTPHHDMLTHYEVTAYVVLPILINPVDPEVEEPTLKGLICIHQCHPVSPWTADELHMLRQLINQICIAFNQAELLDRQHHYLNELHRSNAELEQFAYIASHDLQEPLQIVGNYAQLLNQRHPEGLDQRSQRYLHHIVQGTKQMQQQIEDLLAYSRIHSKPHPMAIIDGGEPLKQAIANLQLRIKTSHATIHLPPEMPPLYGDGKTLQNLWQNLLSNAIKYCGDRPPEITIDYELKDEQWWIFAVRDNGIGIDPTHSERIFRIFQRLHTTEEYPGTGIGLAICQRIVTLHGGKIWVKPNPHQGSTFYFSLPVQSFATRLLS